MAKKPPLAMVKAEIRIIPLVSIRNFCHQLIMTLIHGDRKSRGRPKVGSTHIGVRIPPEQLRQLDGYIASLDPRPPRPEAIRFILQEWLVGHGFAKLHDDPEGVNGLSRTDHLREKGYLPR